MQFLFTRGQHGDQQGRERTECWEERKEVCEGELGRQRARRTKEPDAGGDRLRGGEQWGEKDE